jgi:exonuclease III
MGFIVDKLVLRAYFLRISIALSILFFTVPVFTAHLFTAQSLYANPSEQKTHGEHKVHSEQKVQDKHKPKWGPDTIADCRAYYARLRQPMRVRFPSEGANILLPALERTRRLEDIKDLKIATYNLEQLLNPNIHTPWNAALQIHEPFDRVKWGVKINGLAKTIRRAKPDVLVVQEIEDMATAQLLNHKLNDKYRLILIKGNDGSKNIAFFVKKDLPFDIEAQSNVNHRMTSIADPSRTELVFNRDAPFLFLSRAGSPVTEPPLIAIIGVHFKAQKLVETDKEFAKRLKQAEVTASIYRLIKKKFSRTPIMIVGDFNGDIAHSADLEPLRQLGVVDSMSLTAKKSGTMDKVTHTAHPPPPASTVYSQLDGALLSPKLQKEGMVKDAEVVSYFDEQGNPKPLPSTYEKRIENPSDHFLMSFTLDFQKLLRIFKRE